MTAVALVDIFKIKSPKDVEKLKKAKDLVY